jgi:hypothetical protein
MSGATPTWQHDGIDPGWLYLPGVGSIRSARSYKPGGWWFLPEWLPDTAEHDVGPFPTRAAAIAIAGKMARKRAANDVAA